MTLKIPSNPSIRIKHLLRFYIKLILLLETSFYMVISLKATLRAFTLDAGLGIRGLESD